MTVIGVLSDTRQTGHVTGVIEVTDPADPRLADYVSLTDADLRISLEARHGLVVAEGDKVIRRALAAGYPVRSMLLTAAGLARLAALTDAVAAPVYLVSDEVAQVSMMSGSPANPPGVPRWLSEYPGGASAAGSTGSVPAAGRIGAS